MSPHGTKNSNRKAMSKIVSITHNGPRMSSKKKRKLANENSDPEVLDSSDKYWRAIKRDSLNEKILKHLSAPSRRYKLKDEESILPAKKKRKLLKNGGLESDSDEKNSKKEHLEMQKKLKSKLRKLKKQNLDSELAPMSGVKNKSKKSSYEDACTKGKKSRQKISANYDDQGGVCIYELGEPELKNKTRKKLMAERLKGANHLLNKKKVRVGKEVLTPKNLTKKQKPTLRVDAAKFQLLPRNQQERLHKKFCLKLISDAEGSDSDSSPDKDISDGSCKKSLPKMARSKWADLNKKTKLKMQELESPKSKKSKRQQVSEEDEDDSEDDNDDDDVSSEEEDLSDDDIPEEEEDDDKDEEDEEDEEEDDDEDEDSSDELTNDEKSRQDLKLSNRQCEKQQHDQKESEESREPQTQCLSQQRQKIKQVHMVRHEDRVLLIIKHPYKCHLLGNIQLRVIAGCINILGAKLKADETVHRLYSPTSHMLLKLRTEHPIDTDVSEYMNLLSSMFPDTDRYIDHINPKVVILSVNALNCGFTDWITTIHPYQNLFQNDPLAAKIFFNKRLKPFGISFLKQTHMIKSESSVSMDRLFRSWSSILEGSDSPKLVVCGAQDLGKSTLARTLINMALGTKKAVCFLDCDPGQTEFTPPGCISLNVLTKFILGPPFYHQENPIYNVFFGEVSPAHNLNHYMMCIRSALAFYSRMSERLPLIINTMGWIKGPGKKMIDGILNLASPDHVVLLKRKGDTYLCLKNWHASKVAENPWNFYGDTSEQFTFASPCNWKLIPVDSVAKSHVPSGYKTRLSNPDLRTLAILSYLSAGSNITHNIPYKIRWDSLAIYICHEFVPPNQVLYAINASVVALCNADMTQTSHLKDNKNMPRFFTKRPICKCLGFGFVRGIETETQSLYIISPLPLDVISEVNTIMRGAIHLPLEKLQTQNPKDLMYVDKVIKAP